MAGGVGVAAFKVILLVLFIHCVGVGRREKRSDPGISQ